MEAAIRALSDRNRRRILDLVGEAELSAGDIARHFDVSRSAISQHLTVLKEAGLVTERRDGTRRRYRARPEGFAEARFYLESFWDERLRRLRSEADATPGMPASERLGVERDIVIPTAPEDVWTLLVDSDAMRRWMGVAVVIDPRPGGRYRVEIVPGEVVEGTVLVVDRPTRLAHTWGWVGDADTPVPVGSTVVVYDLLPVRSGTLLRLTHRGLPSVDTAGSHSRGWGHYLERLSAAAVGTAGPDPWVADPTRMMSELGL